MRRCQAALGRAWHHQDLPEIELARKIAAWPRVPCSTAPRFSMGAILSFTIFSRLRTCCHQLFHFLNRGPAVRKWRNLGLNVSVYFKAAVFCRADAARRMPKPGSPTRKSLIHVIFTLKA